VLVCRTGEGSCYGDNKLALCLIIHVCTYIRDAGVRITTRQIRVEFRIGELKYKPTGQSDEDFCSLEISLSIFLASCFLTLRVKILNYSPVWRVFTPLGMGGGKGVGEGK
jgi:hypothetical protein